MRMGKLMVFWAFLLFLLPISSGIGFAVVKKRQINSFFRVQLSVIVLSLLYLSTAGEFTVRTPLVFLGEPLWLSFSKTPMVLFLVAVLTLWVLLFAVKRQEARLSRVDAVLLNFALAFGYAAFFSGQFLMRYISLEIVGLITALSTLGWAEDQISLDRFNVVFILLRLGDLGLLISILLLRVDSGTLNIEEMIKTAVELPVGRQVWIIAGVLVAVAIKLAVWPFWTWLRCAERRKQRLVYWISALLVPSLGMYLLYRFVPIIQSQVVYQRSLALVALMLLIIPWISHRANRAQVSRFLVISNMMGAMFFFGAASGSSGALVLYASGFIIFRLILILQDLGYIRISQYRVLFLLLLVLALPGFFLVWEASFLFALGWLLLTLVIAAGLKGMGLLSPDKGDAKEIQSGREDVPPKGSRTEIPINMLARWMDRKLGVDLINQRVNGLSDVLSQIAAWLYSNVEQAFDRQWIGVEQMTLGISRLTLGKIEQEGADRADSLIRDLVYRIGEHEKQIKENPFRWALLWIPVMLAVVLIIMLALQDG